MSAVRNPSENGMQAFVCVCVSSEIVSPDVGLWLSSSGACRDAPFGSTSLEPRTNISDTMVPPNMASSPLPEQTHANRDNRPQKRRI